MKLILTLVGLFILVIFGGLVLTYWDAISEWSNKPASNGIVFALFIYILFSRLK